MAMSRCDGCTSFTRAPLMRISPSVTDSSPAIMLSRVDLPQPDGPTSTRKSPSSTAMSMRFSTSVPPNRLPMPSISRNAIV